MKITANRKEDLLKQREEYDSKIAALKTKQDEGEKAYRHAVHEKEDILEKKISDLIGPTTLPLTIEVHEDQNYNRDTHQFIDCYRIDLKCGDNWTIRAKSLNWNISINVDKHGQVAKESNSYSGLQAVTAEEIEELEESVRIIKLISQIDWLPIITFEPTRWEDYTISREESKELDRLRDARRNIGTDIRNEVLNEMLGSNIAIELETAPEGVGYRGYKYYILPTRMSSQFVEGDIFPHILVDETLTVDQAKRYGIHRRTKLNNLKWDWNTEQFVTIEVPEA